MALGDLDHVPQNIRVRILRAVETRLALVPAQYGQRLARSLSGLWKTRVGDYRLVYEIQGQRVIIWAIRHRKDVYGEALRRWLSSSGRRGT